MPDPRINTVFSATDQLSPTVKKIKGELGGFQKSVGGVKGAIPIFDKLSAATGGLISPTTLAVGGAVALGAAIVNATKAAAGEQVGIARLGAALQANIQGFDGNTTAIERTIRSREKLAFSDDSLRNSLALLVPATHDVSKALELQAIAMDLSRLRGTDLAETSVLLSKVYQGNLTSLKRFGINLKGVTTATEALAKIQELAAGQAEAYGNTIVGKSEAIDIKLQDLTETIGGAFLPAVDELATGFLTLTTSADATTSELGPLTGAIQGAGDAFIRAIYPMAPFLDSLREIRDQAQANRDAQDKLNSILDRGAERADDMAGSVGDLTGEMRDLRSQNIKVASSYDDLVTAASKWTDWVYGEVQGEDDLRHELDQTNGRLADAKRHLHELEAIKHPTREQRRDLADTRVEVDGLQGDAFRLRGQLANLGDRPSRDAMRPYLDSLRAKLEKGLISAQDYRAALEALGFTYRSSRQTGKRAGRNKRAGGAVGGVFREGDTGPVGESGPERLVMLGGSAMVIPNQSGGTRGGAEAVTVPIVLTLDGDIVYRSVERRQLQRLKSTPFI